MNGRVDMGADEYKCGGFTTPMLPLMLSILGLTAVARRA